MDPQPWMLVSPEGKPITGTLESLRGRANIVPGSARKDDAGGLEFEYEGETEIFWDEQCTVVRDDERVFLDEEGNEFAESELLLVEAKAKPAAAEGAEMNTSAQATIVLTVEGGVIHSVEGIPAGTVLRVVDLDVDGIAPDRLTTLAEGEKVYVSEWRNEEST